MDDEISKIINQFMNDGYENEWIELYLIKKYDDIKIDMIRKTISRLNQQKFRKSIVRRDTNCIISNFSEIECEAAHIIPYAKCINTNISKAYDISNGILLNSCLHKLFDKYIFSINPYTKQIEIKNDVANLSICQYNNKIINIADECIDNLKVHYEIFLREK